LEAILVGCMNHACSWEKTDQHQKIYTLKTTNQ
jgi:hypothetical protein